jgi:hypothetical protein
MEIAPEADDNWARLITEAVVVGLGKTGFRGTPTVLSPCSESVAARLVAANKNVSMCARRAVRV